MCYSLQTIEFKLNFLTILKQKKMLKENNFKKIKLIPKILHTNTLNLSMCACFFYHITKKSKKKDEEEKIMYKESHVTCYLSTNLFDQAN